MLHAVTTYMKHPGSPSTISSRTNPHQGPLAQYQETKIKPVARRSALASSPALAAAVAADRQVARRSAMPDRIEARRVARARKPLRALRLGHPAPGALVLVARAPAAAVVAAVAPAAGARGNGAVVVVADGDVLDVEHGRRGGRERGGGGEAEGGDQSEDLHCR
ncbi:hypothetical protein PCL_08930 [Purpureocillium lilacinum]|uniref:Uncharacterized protein n=1 Tax=Purpureocillium lilacinum TaxID=33203 RepID=A0A2U3EGK0_PURLI|nr:hypothetical protein Purlil1_8242 [Purpureocillium lilacinum]PWI73654.1 hypothetical protein PCL_08930 [Purpureocillium lilacinum]